MQFWCFTNSGPGPEVHAVPFVLICRRRIIIIFTKSISFTLSIVDDERTQNINKNGSRNWKAAALKKHLIAIQIMNYDENIALNFSLVSFSVSNSPLLSLNFAKLLAKSWRQSSLAIMWVCIICTRTSCICTQLACVYSQHLWKKKYNKKTTFPSKSQKTPERLLSIC